MHGWTGDSVIAARVPESGSWRWTKVFSDSIRTALLFHGSTSGAGPSKLAAVWRGLWGGGGVNLLSVNFNKKLASLQVNHEFVQDKQWSFWELDHKSTLAPSADAETKPAPLVSCGRPSPRTVLYGETVEEIQVKDNRETRVERFLHHRSNHPRRSRRPHLPAAQAQRTLHQVRKHAEPATVPPQPNPVRPVRAKQLYALAEMKHFLPNVTIYTLESSTKDTDKPLSGSRPKWHDLSERRVS
ncbi:hypothetical protein pipiens_007291 [Culex pipiens pipiens]|uniref:Uncharacterized protein n=1 Tax=Culex pipiens pipiens TaxID=38569 RepID=A0ABD1DLK1_CULPP